MEVNTRMIRGFVWNIPSTLSPIITIKVHFNCSSIVRVLTIKFSFMLSNAPLLWHFSSAFIIAWNAHIKLSFLYDVGRWTLFSTMPFLFSFSLWGELYRIFVFLRYSFIMFFRNYVFCIVTFVFLEKAWLLWMIGFQGRI